MKMTPEEEKDVRIVLGLIKAGEFEAAADFAEENLPAEIDNFVGGVIKAARAELGI